MFLASCGTSQYHSERWMTSTWLNIEFFGGTESPGSRSINECFVRRFRSVVTVTALTD